ncbi:unnamed protein product [Choristocarpus tenellus]
MGPKEAVETARQLSKIASLVGPGAAAIGQKFFVQLAARTLDRLADSLDGEEASSTTVGGGGARGRGRFYEEL